MCSIKVWAKGVPKVLRYCRFNGWVRVFMFWFDYGIWQIQRQSGLSVGDQSDPGWFNQRKTSHWQMLIGNLYRLARYVVMSGAIVLSNNCEYCQRKWQWVAVGSQKAAPNIEVDRGHNKVHTEGWEWIYFYTTLVHGSGDTSGRRCESLRIMDSCMRRDGAMRTPKVQVRHHGARCRYRGH